MSEVLSTPEAQVKLNSLSLPVAVLLFEGKDKPDGLGLAPFPGYLNVPNHTDSPYLVDPTKIGIPYQPLAQYIGFMCDFGASLPYRFWADRLALTAAWVIEHSGLNRPSKVQSAIVFRETRTTETAWKVCPDGDHLTIQVVHGPRAHTSVRWRISDGMEVTNYGVPLRNQSLRLPNLHFQVEVNTTPEAALLEALHGAGFVVVAAEENALT